ncbi:hypothetical protein V6R21_13935 [Limibacter armeniacum]|uniref:hypothetical protein n=1 Tax=Limibacter armeniacum TaxID=466084 RepID=UPI002FE576C4
MRTLITFFLLGIAFCSQGQFVQNKVDRFLTNEQNESWLTTTKLLDEPGQWKAIKERFFLKRNQNTPIETTMYSPLVVINGIPLDIPDELTDNYSNKILNLLNEDSIDELIILDKLDNEWTYCKPFSGVIILKVDKKTYKKLFKLK